LSCASVMDVSVTGDGQIRKIATALRLHGFSVQRAMN